VLDVLLAQNVLGVTFPDLKVSVHSVCPSMETKSVLNQISRMLVVVLNVVLLENVTRVETVSVMTLVFATNSTLVMIALALNVLYPKMERSVL